MLSFSANAHADSNISFCGGMVIMTKKDVSVCLRKCFAHLEDNDNDKELG